MNYLEIKNVIYCYDNKSCLTFKFENKNWTLSKISLHEIENQDVKEATFLTEKEVAIKTDGKSVVDIKNKILSILN